MSWDPAHGDCTAPMSSIFEPRKLKGYQPDWSRYPEGMAPV